MESGKVRRGAAEPQVSCGAFWKTPVKLNFLEMVVGKWTISDRRFERTEPEVFGRHG